jgi:hypothetical protein
MTTPEKQAQLTQQAEQTTKLLALWQTYQCTSPEHAEFLGQELVKVKTQVKALEGEKEKVTKPLWRAYKDVGDWFAPALKALASLEDTMKGKLGDWDRAQRAAQARALEEASQKFQAGQHEAGLAIMQAVPETPVATKGVSTRSVWRWSVFDSGTVPREYCEPSTTRINEAVANGVRAIPGIRIFEDSEVRVRI